MWKLNDLFGQLQPHPIERLSVLAFDHLDRIAERARILLQTNRPAVERVLAGRDDLETTLGAHGTTVFPKLRSGNVDDLCARLLDRYETSVVPGRFFGMPEHFRIGMGGDTAMTAEGLARLRSALDDGFRT
jgi:aspartate/methionine/tyrosine aminotransferase